MRGIGAGRSRRGPAWLAFSPSGMSRPAFSLWGPARLARALVAAAFAAATLAGCGSNDGPVLALPPERALLLGWEAFENRDYGRAETLFLVVLETDGRNAEALTGIGWSRAYASDLDSAAAVFQASLAIAPSRPDALAGLAAVELARRAWAPAIAGARAALAQDSTWAFAHRDGVNADDLRLIVAEASALRSPPAYDDAQAELDRLDPSNGLDAATPSTWVVDGVSYPTYAEALLAAIELVELRIGAAIP